tara:strand:- start:91 stop:2559 length:2469 start_codon:yes stop_codon:yes gene_type:complete
MGLEKIIVGQLVKVAKDSGKLNDAIDKIKSNVVERGLELVSAAGVDTSLLPVEVTNYLKGEEVVIPDDLTTPENICAMPSLSSQQEENTVRLANQAEIEIEEIFTTTNTIKTNLLVIKGPLNVLNVTVPKIDKAISTASAAVQIIKLIPIPSSVPPGIGVPLSVINIYASVLDNLAKLLDVAKQNIKTVPATLQIMTDLINVTTEKLNQLDSVIDPFLKVLTFTRATAELRRNCVDPGLTQGDVDRVKNGLLNSIQGNLATAELAVNPFQPSDDELEEQLQENADPGYFYKNFRFVVEYDEANEFSFPSRRIRCTRSNKVGVSSTSDFPAVVFNINPQTSPSLEEGAYSYTAGLTVLVDEAKLAIDVYTNNITLWTAPLVRDRISGSDGSFASVNSGNSDELDEYLESLGFIPSGITQPLPTFIRYGGTTTNLNNSPTDIEFGADRLVEDGNYSGGTGLEITSYIQSGTIQVNSPVNIRLKTFGGDGSIDSSYTRGYTESLLTIKRSFSIQDDINPFTGRIIGSESRQEKIDQFIEDNGANSLNILDALYETSQEDTTSDRLTPGTQVYTGSGPGEAVFGMSFIDKLTYIRTQYVAKNRRQSGIYQLIDVLYEKAKPILYNESALWLSQRLFGSEITSRTKYDSRVDRGDGDLNDGLNLFLNAKDAANGVGTGYDGSTDDENTSNFMRKKSVILSMLGEGLKQFLAVYQNLYGDNPGYNNGAWIGSASTIPVIPSNVGADNDDIEVVLQETQLTDVRETTNEIVGTLSLLGTYTYDLEILDSMPAVGGPEGNYPTNFTKFFIEPIATPVGSIPQPDNSTSSS